MHEHRRIDLFMELFYHSRVWLQEMYYKNFIQYFEIKTRDTMNIYEYAMKLEKDGEIYYRDLAEKIEDKAIKTIFILLADEEVKHYITFEKMNKFEDFSHTPSTSLLKHTLSLFRKLHKENANFYIAQSYINAFKSALRTEQGSYDFYLEKGKMLEEGTHKEAFLKIAEEERQHMLLISHLIDFITDPHTWMEQNQKTLI